VVPGSNPNAQRVKAEEDPSGNNRGTDKVKRALPKRWRWVFNSDVIGGNRMASGQTKATVTVVNTSMRSNGKKG
jgi:hypothetical protein